MLVLPYIDTRKVDQLNDDFIVDCCQYYSRQQLRTYLCTADVNLTIGALIAERDGIEYFLTWLDSHKRSLPRPHPDDILSCRAEMEQHGNFLGNF
jgi:hypothetical protein